MKRVLIFCIAAFSVTACVDNSQNKASQEASLRERIKVMEDSMKQKNSLDKELADKMVNAYKTYVDSMPEDSLSPVYLNRAADILRIYPGRQQEALETYQHLHQEYSTHKLAQEAVFMRAFMYDEMGQKRKAIRTYRLFIDQYPSHALASDARNLLKMLTDTGQSDVQRVEKWMQKAENSTQDNS